MLPAMKKAIIILIAALAVPLQCTRGEVLFIDSSTSPSLQARQVEAVCQFYGLAMRRLSLPNENPRTKFYERIASCSESAVILSAQALPGMRCREVLAAARKAKIKNLLVVGSDPALNSGLLRCWSGGAITQYLSLTGTAEMFSCISNFKEITRELSGQRIQVSNHAEKGTDYLALARNHTAQILSQIRTGGEEVLLPTFVMVEVEDINVFWATASEELRIMGQYNGRVQVQQFLTLAPVFMFLRYALGERCWHRFRDDANFCIDDPRLTEPYGHLSYSRLLAEMQTNSFHTTIAFIPWNYDRNEAAVVSLFRSNPDKYSICVHGNNHDHWEFNPARSLEMHEKNVRQALARMEEFGAMNRLPYDRVMVFPHTIGPMGTLGLLKKHSFLATVNAERIPYGAEPRAQGDDLFRLVSLAYENFPSIERFEVNGPAFEIAMHLFLDNPAIFYAHQDLFAAGIDAFNHTAGAVNAIQPEVEWRSLGDIARRLCYYRLRADGDYEVLAFPGSLVLENNRGHEHNYFVRKEESFSPDVRSLKVDDQPHVYNRVRGELQFEITIPPGTSRVVAIEYENELAWREVETSEKAWRVAGLRMLSEWRDMSMSQSALGLGLIRFYYSSRAAEIRRRYIIPFLSIAMLAMAVAMLCAYSIKSRNK
jgi:hypothetical protein